MKKLMAVVVIMIFICFGFRSRYESGISVTLEFADATTDDCNSITIKNGIITAYTLVP